MFVVAAALRVLFMELVVPVVLRLAAQLAARAVVDLVPAELEAASQAELIRQAAEAGLIFPGGLAIAAMAAVAAVELWGPVVPPIAVGALGVPDTLKRQLLHMWRRCLLHQHILQPFLPALVRFRMKVHLLKWFIKRLMGPAALEYLLKVAVLTPI